MRLALLSPDPAIDFPRPSSNLLHFLQVLLARYMCNFPMLSHEKNGGCFELISCH